MSIQIIDNDVLSHVACKMFTSSFKGELNDSYYPCCHNLSETDIESYVNCWAMLNYKYYLNYWTDPEILELAETPDGNISITGITLKIPAVQFLKWLVFIRDNISTSITLLTPTAIEWKSMEFLRILIAQVQVAVIHNMPEYRNATANEVPPLQSAI